MGTLCVIGSMATIKDCMVMRVIYGLFLGSQLLGVKKHTTWVRHIAGKDLLKHIIGLFPCCFVEQCRLSFGISHWAINCIDSMNMPI